MGPTLEKRGHGGSHVEGRRQARVAGSAGRPTLNWHHARGSRHLRGKAMECRRTRRIARAGEASGDTHRASSSRRRFCARVNAGIAPDVRCVASSVAPFWRATVCPSDRPHLRKPNRDETHERSARCERRSSDSGWEKIGRAGARYGKKSISRNMSRVTK